MTPEIARKVIGHFRQETTKSSELESLTQRENEVLQLIMHGLTNKEIAGRLGISLAGVRFHLQHVYEKLHVHSRAEAVLNYKKYYMPE